MATQQDKIDRAMLKRLVRALERIGDKLERVVELAEKESK